MLFLPLPRADTAPHYTDIQVLIFNNVEALVLAMWLSREYSLCFFSVQVGLAWFYSISTFVGYLIPNLLYTCIRYIIIWFALLWLNGIPTLVGYLMSNPLSLSLSIYIYIYIWSRDELIRDVLLWTPTHGRAKAGRPAQTYIQQLCEDTWCCPEDLPTSMNDREEWREMVRDIRATSATWRW